MWKHLLAALSAAALSTALYAQDPYFELSPPVYIYDAPKAAIEPYAPFEITVATHTGLNPHPLVLQNTSLQGSRLILTYTARGGENFNSFDNYYKHSVPGLPPGEYSIEVTDPTGRSYDYYQRLNTTKLVVKDKPSTAITTMFFREPLANWKSKYFLATSAAEVTTLMHLNDPVTPSDRPTWDKVEETLYGWKSATEAPAAAKPVCRFFHPGISTHFFSANPNDCAAVRSAGGWTDEGTPFYALLPVAGACGMGTEPVYRLYSPGWNTHRYTRSADTYRTMPSYHDWQPEGVVFCSPKQ